MTNNNYIVTAISVAIAVPGFLLMVIIVVDIAVIVYGIKSEE